MLTIITHLLPLSIKEITTTINSFKPLKAPGPDGLHPYFYQKYWSQIANSVTSFCQEVFTNQHISPLVNKIYLCLIPKYSYPSSITQYRPIGFCNTPYKIITKIIINRIKPLLPKLISPERFAFLKERRASDNAIIVEEILNYFKKKKVKQAHFLLKLDLEKAFDQMECAFINKTLHYFNFLTTLI